MVTKFTAGSNTQAADVNPAFTSVLFGMSDGGVQAPMCPTTADYLLIVGGERMLGAEDTSPMDGFFLPSMTLPFAKEHLGWTDAQVTESRLKAESFFLKKFGVDFTMSEFDPNTFMKMSSDGNFAMTAIINNANARTYYNSELGDFTDCPVPMLIEQWTMLAMGPQAMYKGEFGGAMGSNARPGEAAVYGHVMMDYFSNGSFERLESWSISPARPTADGLLNSDCIFVSDVYGMGRGQGAMLFTPMEATSRSIISFPARVEKFNAASFLTYIS